MQRIAKNKVNGEEKSVAAPPTPSQQPSKPTAPPASTGGNFIEQLLGSLQLDRDRMVILLLFVVLVNEGVDGKLLLALCYLLL